MRCYISVVCALSVLATLSYAAPATLDQLETEQIAVLGQQVSGKSLFEICLTLLSFNSLAPIASHNNYSMA